MSANKHLMVGVLLLLLVFGCSKKKEEAAELEKELMGQQDTVAEVTAEPVDTAGPAAVAAAPQERRPPVEPEPIVSGYTVQVAGCEDRAYAEHLIEVYTERGYEPYLTTATVGGQTYYRVRLGSFASLSEAKALKSELRDRFSLDAWIDYVD